MTEWDTGRDYSTIEDFGTVPYPEPEAGELELEIVPLAAFAGVDEPGANAVLGTADSAVIPEGGDVMIYGDGGVGKTTLTIDLACHLAAGDEWLELPVPRAVRVLLVENEGPRPLFRRKLARKLAGWQGSPLDDRVKVLAAPWGQLDFSSSTWRAGLAAAVTAHETDVLVVGPVTSIGMEGAGTIAEARAFLALVDDVRRWSGRPLVVILVHHENKGGKVSGAWEGAGDTLLHVQQQGHGRTRVYFQKARWASEQHATTLHLAWSAGDSFVLAEPELATPERIWTGIEEYVLRNGGCRWIDLVEARGDDGKLLVQGKRSKLSERRDAMLRDDDPVLFNTAGAGRYELWHRDDPARPRLLDEGDSEVIPEGESQTDDQIPEGESRGNLGGSAAVSGAGFPGQIPKIPPVGGNLSREHLSPPDNGPIPEGESRPPDDDEW